MKSFYCTSRNSTDNILNIMEEGKNSNLLKDYKKQRILVMIIENP